MQDIYISSVVLLYCRLIQVIYQLCSIIVLQADAGYIYQLCSIIVLQADAGYIYQLCSIIVLQADTGNISAL